MKTFLLNLLRKLGTALLLDVAEHVVGELGGRKDNVINKGEAARFELANRIHRQGK